jgi:hypothetical protein
MRKLLLMAGAAAMAVGAAGMANGQGRGGGHGKGHAQAERGGGGGQDAHRGRGGQRQDGDRGRGRGRGGDDARAGGQGRGGGEARAERRQDRAERRQERAERRDDRGERRQDRAERRAERQDRGRGGEQRAVRLTERRAAVVREPERVVRLRYQPDQFFVRGCPPGLARRNNGCLPPGQERQLQRAWYDDWWGWDRDDSYVYDGGYLYRVQPGAGAVGYVPLLGGALWTGNVWPASFDAYSVPDYHVDYFGLDDLYDYRHADGVIYGLDPETQAIQAVVGLLTGDQWAIGQPMPAGYDIYNLPDPYRDQYADSADAWYRYSDGYVYQVDPTTQLVQAVIQLIT